MRILTFVLAAFTLLSCACAEPVRPAALVTAVSGRVSVTGGVPAAVGESLPEGARLQLAADASVTLLYGNGQIVEFRGAEQSAVVVSRDSTRGGAMQRLGGKGRETAGAIFETRSRGVNSGEMVYDDLRGGGEGWPLSPRDERVRSRGVQFHWTGDEAAQYHFVLTPAAGRPLVDVTVKGTSYSLPMALSPAVRYKWSAAPMGAEPDVASFSTLSAADEIAVDEAQASIERATPARGTSRSLLLGLLYEKFGLYHDAISRLQGLPPTRWLSQELAWLYYQVGDLARSKALLEASRKP